MKRAIVLSGGGGKGAYQIGFWKAIRELDIEYNIVTGTSIGALNGAFMVQGNYKDAIKLWTSMNYDKVFDSDLENTSYYTKTGRKKVIMNYAKAATKGGLSVPGLEKIIDDNLKHDLFYSSNVDYGLVTVKFPSLKPVMLTKKELKRELLGEYLLATASCFPAFKMTEINNESYIDGGYYDNMPIELAIKLGAEEIIAVDLSAAGRKRKIPETNIPITIIKAKGNIGNFLVLEKKQSKRLMKIGYNDTMKTFKKLDGDYYTFKKGSLKRNYNRLFDRFKSNLKSNIKGKDIAKYSKKLTNVKEIDFNRALENLMKAFNLDDVKVYRTSYANVQIKKALKKEKDLSFKLIKKMITANKLNKNFVNKEIICYIYEELLNRKECNRILSNLALLLPESYLCAIYLKTIMK